MFSFVGHLTQAQSLSRESSGYDYFRIGLTILDLQNLNYIFTLQLLYFLFTILFCYFIAHLTEVQSPFRESPDYVFFLLWFDYSYGSFWFFLKSRLHLLYVIFERHFYLSVVIFCRPLNTSVISCESPDSDYFWHWLDYLQAPLLVFQSQDCIYVKRSYLNIIILFCSFEGHLTKVQSPSHESLGLRLFLLKYHLHVIHLFLHILSAKRKYNPKFMNIFANSH